jgi:hypothetical protein
MRTLLAGPRVCDLHNLLLLSRDTHDFTRRKKDTPLSLKRVRREGARRMQSGCVKKDKKLNNSSNYCYKWCPRHGSRFEGSSRSRPQGNHPLSHSDEIRNEQEGRKEGLPATNSPVTGCARRLELENPTEILGASLVPPPSRHPRNSRSSTCQRFSTRHPESRQQTCMQTDTEGHMISESARSGALSSPRMSIWCK